MQAREMQIYAFAAVLVAVSCLLIPVSAAAVGGGVLKAASSSLQARTNRVVSAPTAMNVAPASR